MHFENNLVKFTRLLPLALLPIQIAVAQDITDKWEPLAVPVWAGKQAPNGAYDLADGLVSYNLPLPQVEGRWVRLSASTNANMPDFFVLIHAFNEEMNPLTKVLPTRCEIKGERKICSNVNWIKPGGKLARVGFFSNALPSIIVPGAVEVGGATPPLPANVARYRLLSKEIEKLYYRSKEANWARAKSNGELLLTAPKDIDPVPVAISRLIESLPGSSHSAIFLNGDLHQTEPPLPKCSRLNDTTWRLDLPGTPNKAANYAGYISKAQQCFAQPSARRWLINLTQSGGGDAALMFAALAPVLGSGPQMLYRNADGEEFVVHLSDRTVSTNGKISQRWPKAARHANGEVIFVTDAGCGSACEAIAIAAKGRFKLLGQTTAGYATANESIPISDTFSLALTAGYMVDMKGKVYSKVKPDIALDEAATQKLLSDGKY